MRERAIPLAAWVLSLWAASPAGSQTQVVRAAPAATGPFERVTFEEAVSRAIEHHPTVGEAAQAILRAQALLDQSKSVFRPSLYGDVAVVTLDAARGFDGFETSRGRRRRSTRRSRFPILDAAGWAAKNRAADQVEIARISAEETRRQVATTAAQAYLAVIAAQRQTRDRDPQPGHGPGPRGLRKGPARRRQGQPPQPRALDRRSAARPRLQLELAELFVRQAQEALGVAVFADAPLDANGDPDLQARAAARRATRG